MSDVGQPDKRMWDTDKERERKAAQRARQREQVAVDAELEAYVARELAITQAQIDRGQIRTHALQEGKQVALDPLLRSERYARWRYAGFRAGEIASL